MYRFSRKSRERLGTAHPELIEAIELALEASPVDFGISCGHRDRVAQMIAYQEGRSRLAWPRSRHNRQPAEAVDFFPVVDGRAVWSQAELFHLVAGLVLGIAAARGWKFRWGGAWSGTLNGPDRFHDLPHIERIQ